MDPLLPFQHRRSAPSRLLSDPGPDDAQLAAMLACAVRVPDHGKLTPWRFLAIRGPARQQLGEFVARRGLERQPQSGAAAVEKDRNRFSHAPLVITVIGRPRSGHKVPEQEQLLSGGALCLQLLQAADALGFGAQWLTGWAAYDPAVRARLGVQDDEVVLGFIHIGSATGRPPERERPDPAALLTEFEP